MATPKDEGPDVTIEESEVTVGPQEEKVVEMQPDEAPAESSAEEQTASEVEQEESVEQTESEGLTDEERKNLSMKARKRFHELDRKGKDAEARAEAAERELEQLRKGQSSEFTEGLDPLSSADSRPTAPPRLPWESDVEAGETRELTTEDYKRDVLTTADWLVKTRLGQVEKVNEVKTDLNKLQSKYDVLNPDSSNYDKDLSTKLAGLFRNQLRADPRSTLYSFVDSVMEVRQKGKDEGTSETTAVLAKQKSEEALTPDEADQTAMSETKFEDLSLDEQEKYLKSHGMWE